MTWETLRKGPGTVRKRTVGLMRATIPAVKECQTLDPVWTYEISGSNEMANATLVLALVSVGLGVVFSMMIVHEVSKRGVKINFPLLRLYIIKYVHQYGQLTRQETGKAAPLYYLCTGSYMAALALAVVHLIIR
jgi:hypothetical protein